MASGPSTTNPAAQAVTDIIKAAIMGAALEAAKAGLRADFPWLNLPIISGIFDLLMNRLGNYFYVPMAQAGALATIKIETDEEKKNYAAAEAELHAARASGDPSALALATARFKLMLGPLIHWDGSPSI